MGGKSLPEARQVVWERPPPPAQNDERAPTPRPHSCAGWGGGKGVQGVGVRVWWW